MFILSDVDDVLLDYTSGFANYFDLSIVDPNGKNIEQIYNTGKDTWEMVDEFNHSDSFRHLAPVSNALPVITRLTKEGYKVHVITACGDSDKIKESRYFNLTSVFGDIFHDISFVSYHESKYKHLANYKDSGHWWIEDNVDNYNLGLRLGLKSALLSPHDDLPVNHQYKDWEDIYLNIRSL